MKAEFLKRAQYGKTRYYPQNSVARAFTSLLRQKTLTPDDFLRVEIMKQLGLEVVVYEEGPDKQSGD